MTNLIELYRLLLIVIIFGLIFINININTLRIRYIYEKNLWNKVEEDRSYINNNIKIRYNYKNKKVIKRYYTKSSYSLVKEKIIEIAKIVEKVIILPTQLVQNIGQNFNNYFANTITTKNVSKEAKIQSGLTNREVEKIITVGGQNPVSYDHRGFVKGVKINEDETVNLTYFETATKNSNHEINIKMTPEEYALIKENGGKLIVPTLNVLPGNEPLKVSDDFTIINKGIVIVPVINTKIQLDKNNVIELQKGLVKDLQERKEGFMETVGWKGYEFFYKGIHIYGVHKDDIYRVGGLIMYVNMKKAKPLTSCDYSKICKEIANNPEVVKFINIDPKTKEIYEQNYKILKDLKKD